MTCWGNNEYEESDPPEGIFQSISAGFAHNCGLRPEGTVECWNEDRSAFIDPVPTLVNAFATTEDQDACWILADDTVACWRNLRGSYYHGTEIPIGTFQSV